MIVNVLLFLFVAVLGGFGSSWYMIEHGTPLTTRTSGPWTTWTGEGRTDSDPYTRAHFLRRGVLPVTTAYAQTFQAETDSDGQRLFSSCEYLVDGDEPQGAFWTLAVFDHDGRLIPNPADRYAFSSATLTRGSAGRLDIVLARGARPGNWLPTGGAGRFVLHLTVEEPAAAGSRTMPPLPAIRRIGCR